MTMDRRAWRAITELDAYQREDLRDAIRDERKDLLERCEAAGRTLAPDTATCTQLALDAGLVTGEVNLAGEVADAIAGIDNLLMAYLDGESATRRHIESMLSAMCGLIDPRDASEPEIVDSEYVRGQVELICDATPGLSTLTSREEITSIALDRPVSA